MSSITDQDSVMTALTDCLHYIGNSCMYNNRCRYRHYEIDIKQQEKCPNWPKSCRDIKCPLRHPNLLPKRAKPLPPEGGLVSFYWDIENVHIPKGQKPFDIIQRIRQKLMVEPGLREYAFSCYCNSTTLSHENQLSLDRANVTIVHIPSREIGSADNKIRLELDRFERTQRPPATVVLISGDIDFVAKLSDLRHQAGFRVIVIHNEQANEALKATANDHYPWKFFAPPSRSQKPTIGDNNLVEPKKQVPGRQSPSKDKLNKKEKLHQTDPPTSTSQPLMELLISHDEHNLPPNNYPPADNVDTKAKLPKTSRCPYCTNEYDSITALRQHQKDTKHLSFCPECNAGFPTLAAVTQHRTAKHSISKEVPTLHSTNTNQPDGQYVGMTSSGDQILPTVDDDSIYRPFPSIEINPSEVLLQSQEAKNYVQCPSESKEGSSASKNVKEHNVSMYECDQCNTQFLREFELTRHRFITNHVVKSNTPTSNKVSSAHHAN